MLWLAPAFAAGLAVGYLIGTRSSFAEGYLRGLKKQVGVDDLLDLFDEADRKAWADGPPERPEVTS